MMINMIVAMIGPLIGCFLAAGTGWFLQKRQEASRIKMQRELFIVGIKDDLNNSIELYDHISEGWRNSKTIWFNLMSEISDSRHTYTDNRSHILLIEDKNLRAKITQYYRKSYNHLLSLQNAQQRIYDIENKYRNFVQSEQLKNPQLAAETVASTVAGTMTAESQGLNYWMNDQIPALISSLEGFKNEAREIRDKLEKLR